MEIQDGTIQDLKDWLIGRVGDDNDVVIDDLQAELNDELDKLDEENGIKGSVRWRDNVAAVSSLSPPSDLPDLWEWDGFRKCRYHGKRNGEGKPEGEGALLYENKDTFQGVFFGSITDRQGVLTFATRNDEMERIEGTWKNGLLLGEIRASLLNTGWIEGYYKDGVPHGFFREFGPRCQGVHMLRMTGRYFKGVRRGVCWKGMYDNSGWLVGEVDDKGDFTGRDIAYVYPEMKFALKGEFLEEKLVRGQMCELIGCTDKNGFKMPKFSEPAGQVYEYECPSIKNIALHPLLRDPWEDTKVEVKESKLPQGGEGLFAKSDIQKREIVALYNGIKVKTSTYASEHMPRSDYRIRLNADIDMDIPFGYHKLGQYQATLAHKANHSFSPNVEWTLFEHPRFGLIRSLTAAVEIPKGEEILVNYQMTLAKSPDWYRCVWLHWMRKVKRGDDAAIQRYIDRQYELQGYRIPLPESEELNVPEPVGVDLTALPEKYLSEEFLTEEAAVQYARRGPEDSQDTKEEDRFTELSDDDSA